MTLYFANSPGSTNIIQTTTDLNTWHNVYTNLADPKGFWQFTDTNTGLFPPILSILHSLGAFLFSIFYKTTQTMKNPHIMKKTAIILMLATLSFATYAAPTFTVDASHTTGNVQPDVSRVDD